MVLPVVSLALIEVPVYLRLLRSEMIGTLQQNFIALARGMGLPTWRILLENALRPSSLNLITVVGINMGPADGRRDHRRADVRLAESASCWSSRSTSRNI